MIQRRAAQRLDFEARGQRETEFEQSDSRDRDVQVDGHINGNVSCARLTIGKDGEITGDIKAKEIVVRGKVKGAIRAIRVMLMEGADVAGDIFYDRMSMEEGARFVGASNAEPLPSTASHSGRTGRSWPPSARTRWCASGTWRPARS